MKLQRNIGTLLTFVAAVLLGVTAVVAVGAIANAWGVGTKEVTKTTESLPPMTSEEFTPPQVDEDNSEEFDPEGIYESILNTDIKGFVINNKNLEFDCDDARFGTLTTPKLFVTDREDDVFAAPILTIENGELGFTTETLKKTKYSFTGEFLVKGNFYTLDPDKKVVSGKLTKFVDGKKVSETELSFTWSIDLDCVC